MNDLIKKKIIIAVPYLSGKGGTETVIKNFHKALSTYDDNRYVWKLISYGGSKYFSWIKQWNKKIYNFSDLRYIQNLFYIFVLPFLIGKDLKTEKPDYFIATNPIIWTLAFYERKVFSKKTKIISWYHFSFKKKNINKRYLKTVDYFWAISTGIKKELVSLGVDPQKIDIVYNPIDTRNISQVKRSGKRNHIIYIGRIDYNKQKNVSELMNVLNKLSGEWQCDLYGAVDKKTKFDLLSLIDSSKKKHQIKFHGFLDDVWEHIKVADILVLTSNYEGFGMVLCEAAARGISLISSDCPVGPADVVNENNGWLYKKNDDSELFEIINTIINNNLELPNPVIVRKSIEKFNLRNYISRIFNLLSTY